MREWGRALGTLLAVAVAGALLWYVPHFNRWTAGGYWAVMTLMAAAGAVIGFSQLRGSGGSPTARFVVVFLPVAVVTGWVLVASQPRGNWFRDHVREWSGDLGIDGVVDNLDNHVAVVAFGLGVIFGVRFDPRLLRRRRKPAVTAAVGKAPVVATPAATPGGTVTGDTAATQVPGSVPGAPAGEETVVDWPGHPRDGA